MTKEEKYAALLPAARSLMDGEEDLIARMANLAALLHSEFGFWWTGFYRVADGILVLGPFQGPVACTSESRSAYTGNCFPLVSGGSIGPSLTGP